MRLGGKVATAVGAGALTAALSAPALAAPATVLIHPDMQYVGHAFVQPPTTAQCEATFQVACYQPPQIQQAYDLPVLYGQGITGQGATIVIVDSFGSPTITSDLATFDQQFGLAAPPSFRIIQPAGAVPPFNPDNSSMVSWAGETTLDVEYAHAIAPGASILLVETPVAETEGVTGFPEIVKAEEYVIDHHLGDVISQSFSATEQTFTSLAAVQALRGAYTDAYQHHVTVLTASGDDGAANVGADGRTFYTVPTTSWPASDPLVTAVGGSQLHLAQSGARTGPDTVWNDTNSQVTNQFIFGNNGPNPLASGGGISVLFPRPGFQDAVQNVVGNWRGVPDVSMSAACNGAVDVYQSFGAGPAGWSETCGTSEAAPLFAGIVALAVQVAHHSLGLINPALYEMSAQGQKGLVGITSGNNAVAFLKGGKQQQVPGFSAGPGYNLATGLGTVDAAYFVPELVSLAGR
jgi:subtilase family serine protease